MPEGLAADHRDYDISDPEALEALRRAEDRHFWQTTRARMIARRLKKLGLPPGASVLDLGCGMGCVSAVLARAGYRVTGVDGHQPQLDVAARRSPGSTFLCRDLRQGTGGLGTFDAAALFDVIEHLDAPVAALQSALACVRPGGLLVGTVPALMWLWSPIDAASGHKLRYGRDTLRATLEQVRGAQVLSIAPFNRALVPLLWLHRRKVGDDKVGNLTVPWAPVNAAMRALLGLENALAPALDRTPLPGASLWFALRRDA